MDLSDVQRAAYLKWEAAGKPEGQDLHFWNLAKEEFNKLHWGVLSSAFKLSEDFIREFQDKVDWLSISIHQVLSEDFIREFRDKLYLSHVVAFQQVSEDFVREFQDEVDWNCVSSHLRLSEDFIREFQDKVKWDYIAIYQQLSEDFIREFQDKIGNNRIPVKLTREEKIEKLSPYYTIIGNKVIAYKSTRTDGYSFMNFRYQYEVGKTYESWCDCTENKNSFGLSAWTRFDAVNFVCLNHTGSSYKLFKVEIDLDDIGAIVHDYGKLRCFKFKVIEEVNG